MWQFPLTIYYASFAGWQLRAPSRTSFIVSGERSFYRNKLEFFMTMQKCSYSPQCATICKLVDNTTLHSLLIWPMFSRPVCVRQMALAKTTIVCKTQVRFANDCCFRQCHLPHTSRSRKHCTQPILWLFMTYLYVACRIPSESDVPKSFCSGRLCQNQENAFS